MQAIALLAVFLSCAGIAQAHLHTYRAILTGMDENEPNDSTAIGTCTLTLDLDLITMRVEIDFSGLAGTTSAAILYGQTALPLRGSAAQMSPALTSSGFPAGVQAGHYDFTFDLTEASGYDAAFISASGGTISNALNALIVGFEEQRVYLDLKTTAYPSGEIRGFFMDVLEPPPSLEITASPDASGLVTLLAKGPAETSSVLQTSRNLTTWSNVETLYFNGVSQTINYQATPNEAYRYFRLQLP